MNEKASKRREWVKTVAIIFLSVLLVLTFFSQTIMNFSLPEVSTEYAESGTVTTKIRGTGTVASGDLYEQNADSSHLGRKILEVAVSAGDTVKRGDVLLVLDEGDSSDMEEAKEQLESAKEELKSAKESYDNKLLSRDTTVEIIQQSHSNATTEALRAEITRLQQGITQAQQDEKTKKAELQKRIEAFESQIEWTTNEETGSGLEKELQAIRDAEKAKKDAENALEEATLKYNEAKKEYDDAVAEGAGDNRLERLKEKMEKALEKKEQADNTLEKAKNALSKAKEAKDTTKRAMLASLKAQKEQLEKELDNLGNAADDYDEQLTQFTSNLMEAQELRKLYDDVVEAQKAVVEAQDKINKLEQGNAGSKVVADINGKVTSISLVAGKKLEDSEVCMIQPEGKGYSMSFSVTTEQARTLSVGDKAELVNAWYYDDMDITLATIKPDKSDPANMKELIFDVVGEVKDGQRLDVSVGQKSANYDHIVPNSAIREDNNGKFILIVESKSSPLGNRYIARREAVQVVARDDTKSAVIGDLDGYEFVITNSTKPVEAGKQVRLAD